MKLYAVCAPGIEPVLAMELNKLGLTPTKAEPGNENSSNSEDEGGGIEFEGDLLSLYRANLNLRTANRILVRMGNFIATNFAELRKKASKLPWSEYIHPGSPLSLRTTCHKSRLYHSDAVSERIFAAIGDSIGALPKSDKVGSESSTSDRQLVVVRMVNDHCYISLDSSGDHLHRRGYRLASAKAPVRETLAAAIIMMSGWNCDTPILDPFCGSGTFPIEAALMACGVPPGKNRTFSFQHWKNFNSRTWQKILDGAPPPKSNIPLIQGSDRDAGAISIASANAERAGVSHLIEFSHRAVSSIVPPAIIGQIITNPPYGLRISSTHDLRNLYAQMGKVFCQSCPGWKFAILTNLDQLFNQTRLSPKKSFRFINGGIKVKLFCGEIPQQD